MLWRVRVGASQQEAVIGVMPTGGPHLLAVDHPFLTIERRGRLKAGQVATRVRLRESLTPTGRTLQNAGQELLLLLLGTPLEQRRPDEGVAKEIAAHRRLGIGELLRQHDPLHGRQTLAAVFGRPSRTDPSTFEQLCWPLFIELLTIGG